MHTKTKHLILVIASNIVWIVLFVPVTIMATMSVMLFDAPGSQNAFFTVALFFSMWSIPALSVLSIPGSWIFHFLKKNVLTIIFCFLPLAGLICVALSFLGITIFYHGSLTGS